MKTKKYLKNEIMISPRSYQGCDGKIFGKSILDELLILSKYNFLFFKENDFIGKNLQFLTAVSEESFSNVKSMIIKNYNNLTEFENKTIRAVCFKNNSNLYALIFMVKNKYMTFDRDVINQDIFSCITMELMKSKIEFNLTFLNDYQNFPEYIFFSVFIDAIAKQMSVSIDEFYSKMYENTLEHYISHYFGFKNTKIKLNDFVHEEVYSHSKVFSYYYFWVIKIISDILADKGSGYSFHDVGTQWALLPVMLMRLSREDAFGLGIKKIIASDYIMPTPVVLSFMKKISNESIMSTCEFVQLDLLDPKCEYPEVDITTIIHVIEHFPDDEAALKSILRLWERTKHLLIVLVPMEENKKWPDHHVLFDSQKLRKWATYFKGGKFLSDSYCEDEYTPLINLGFLIIQRE